MAYRITQVSLSLRSQTGGWTFCFRISWYRAEIMVPSIMESCPGHKAAPHHHTTTTMLTVGMMFYFCLINPQDSPLFFLVSSGFNLRPFNLSFLLLNPDLNYCK
ncbi:hypothetical protein GOODEAATRI_003155 [Goodea atripinnis]|uniref:Uncharacterized protein n=1 Tax=Goodea atripinnis TaxID=208336 RepID=A0ABV0PUW1_9TELE